MKVNWVCLLSSGLHARTVALIHTRKLCRAQHSAALLANEVLKRTSWGWRALLKSTVVSESGGDFIHVSQGHQAWIQNDDHPVTKLQCEQPNCSCPSRYDQSDIAHAQKWEMERCGELYEGKD